MSNNIIDVIKRNFDNRLESKIIKDLIQENESTKKRVSRLYNEYTGDVDILNYKGPEYLRENNQLPNDYRGDIIDQVVGYTFGTPITYNLLEPNKNSPVNDYFTNFMSRNNIEDLDSLTGELACICGYSARLLYVDIEGNERVMNINPWEIIFVNDATIDELQYALIYYPIKVQLADGRTVERTKVEWYDKKNITFYIEDEKGNYFKDNFSEAMNPRPHLFDYVPLIKYKNNDIEKGDFEKVNKLINAYDEITSMSQNDIEQYRSAYFTITGAILDDETINKAKQTGALNIPEGASAGFLTKDLNGVIQAVENQKRTLNDNIYKFSKSVDMTDEQFSGSAMSGESRKWKLVGLESKAIKKVRKFAKANREMFRILASAWKKKGIIFDPEKVEMVFTRTLPVDTKYFAEVTQLLKGMISEETRISMLPFVPNVQTELEKMASEADNYNLNFEEDNEQPNDEKNQKSNK